MAMDRWDRLMCCLTQTCFVFCVCPISLLSLTECSATSTDFRTSQLPAAKDGETDLCFSFACAINNFAIGSVGFQ